MILRVGAGRGAGRGIAVCLLVVGVVAGQAGQEMTVQTRAGRVRGERQATDLGKEVDVWASIPYAEPPLGNLR